MSKRDYNPIEFDTIKNENETIIWVGKPKLVPFMAQGIPLLIFGMGWGAFVYFFFQKTSFLGGFEGIDRLGQMSTLIKAFLILYLFPVYGSVLNMLRLILVYKNTRYAYTNQHLMFKTGFFGIDFKVVDYDKIQNIEVNVGPLEKLFHVGTMRIFSGELSRSNNQGIRPIYFIFKAIDEPYDVFKAIKQISLDIKTDWNYPNKLRPDENDGYPTKYTPKE